jgi:hypothetical protein
VARLPMSGGGPADGKVFTGAFPVPLCTRPTTRWKPTHTKREGQRRKVTHRRQRRVTTTVVDGGGSRRRPTQFFTIRVASRASGNTKDGWDEAGVVAHQEEIAAATLLRHDGALVKEVWVQWFLEHLWDRVVLGDLHMEDGRR